ncbi:LOW QUALITY PROTEIN: hypothetical protein T265_15494 [Opisthorchis viverrini]|uniref:Uncharacterized protein n=1 Tax=Opisthorchis viverrini TaxID=6198 RepID=A0A074Z269_OPIVI|nr:LOW QUALITY PROTEIN: hypothetical protein T265_15494 [Opisthorchis viverrini]KER19597.1 LOW QUALITY PROTEIN: hypothetical protein T265_15494 [Opisthorchis viverrini]
MPDRPSLDRGSREPEVKSEQRTFRLILCKHFPRVDVIPQLNFLTLSTLVHDKENAIRFLQRHGVIHQQHICNDGHQMTLSTASDRCNARQCQQEIGLRKRTWLERSRMEFGTRIVFIYFWFKNLRNYLLALRPLLTGRTFFAKFAPGGSCRLQQLSAAQVYATRSMKRQYFAVKTTQGETFPAISYSVGRFHWLFFLSRVLIRRSPLYQLPAPMNSYLIHLAKSSANETVAAKTTV